MPDIKTALETALSTTINSWAQEDAQTHQTKQTPQEKQMTTTSTAKPYHFKETVGVSRAVFDHVKNNPGQSRPAVLGALLAKGYKKGSVDSLLTQYVRGGVFAQNDQGHLWTLVQEYAAVPSPAKARSKKLTHAKPKASADIALPRAPRRLSTADFLEECPWPRPVRCTMNSRKSLGVDMNKE